MCYHGIQTITWEDDMNNQVAGIVSLILALCFAGIVPGRAQAPSNSLPLVWVLSTGGTIAGRGASPTNVADYKGGQILGEELVNAVPEIKQFADVKVQQIINVRS